MAHTHKKSTAKKPGALLKTTGAGHKHKKSKYTNIPVASGDPNLPDAPSGGGGFDLPTSLPHHKALHARAHKSSSRSRGRHSGHNTSDFADSGQGDYAGKGAFGGAMYGTHTKRSARHKSGGHRGAGKAAGHGHTHKKGAGSSTSHAHKKSSTHTATHLHSGWQGHDSRNYTPAAPHDLQTQTAATPLHPHQK